MIAWILTVIIGSSVAVAYSILITIFSKQVSDDEQGWVMGITNSVMALAFGVTALLSGFAANYSPALPIYFAFIGTALAAIILHFSHPKSV